MESLNFIDSMLFDRVSVVALHDYFFHVESNSPAHIFKYSYP